MLMDTNTLTIGALLAVLLGLLSSKVVLDWTLQNGERLGRMIAKRVPGDKFEEWLKTFLRGVADGLEAEIKEDDEETKVSAPHGDITYRKSKLSR